MSRWLFPWSGSIKKRACRYLLQHYLGHFLQERLSLDQLGLDLYNGSGIIKEINLDVWVSVFMGYGTGLWLGLAACFASQQQRRSSCVVFVELVHPCLFRNCTRAQQQSPSACPQPSSHVFEELNLIEKTHQPTRLCTLTPGSKKCNPLHVDCTHFSLNMLLTPTARQSYKVHFAFVTDYPLCFCRRSMSFWNLLELLWR